MLRAATVLFGESLPEEPLRRAIAVASGSDLMLVVGSTLIVQPAAQIPVIAARSGATLAIVNNEATPLDHLATVVIRGTAGEVLSSLSDALLDTAQADGSG
jgi:NAD-dependent deacetylase